MARCFRCGACISMWSNAPCARCNYPLHDKRTENDKKDEEE